jgi:hypothetical protein
MKRNSRISLTVLLLEQNKFNCVNRFVIETELKYLIVLFHLRRNEMTKLSNDQPLTALCGATTNQNRARVMTMLRWLLTLTVTCKILLTWNLCVLAMCLCLTSQIPYISTRQLLGPSICLLPCGAAWPVNKTFNHHVITICCICVIIYILPRGSCGIHIRLFPWDPLVAMALKILICAQLATT